MLPCAAEPSNGFPINQHTIPLDTKPQALSTAPRAARAPSALLVPAPILLHYLLIQAQPYPPAVPGLPSHLALCLRHSRFRFQEPLSGARASRKAGFLDTALSNAGTEIGQAELMGPKDSLTPAFAECLPQLQHVAAKA